MAHPKKSSDGRIAPPPPPATGSGPPVLIVRRSVPREDFDLVFSGLGIRKEFVDAATACEKVASGLTDRVLCEALPGWQALVQKVVSEGGRVVLLGPIGNDLRGAPSEGFEVVDHLGEVPRALERAAAQLAARRKAARSTAGLLERAQSAELVNRFAQRIAIQLDVPGVVREAVARTRDLCIADGAALLLIDPSTGELYFDVVAGGADRQIERIRLGAGEGIAGKVAQTAQAIKVDEVSKCPYFAKQMDHLTGFRTGAVIAAPLLSGGDVIGVLEAVRSPDAGPFDDGHFRRLVDLSPHVAIAVNNAQLTARLRESQAEVLLINQELERKVEERTQEILVTQAKLRESERLASVGQLASGAAHEINNPMGFLTANLDLLKTMIGELPMASEDVAEARELIDEALQGAKRVSHIVRGLRELSRLELGTPEPTTVNPSVTRVVRSELGEAFADLRLDLKSDRKVTIPPLQLDQALSQLVRNARQAIKPGQRIHLITADDRDWVRIDVRDEGCGIPKEIVHRIFDPFFTTRGVGGGLGLGLTAAYGIIQRHGGTLEVASEPGKGSTFTIRLPIAKQTITPVRTSTQSRLGKATAIPAC